MSIELVASSPRPPHARRLASALVPLVVALVGLGGVVHSTGSSLACPDWPLCHGEWMPDMRGGVEYEHSHRLLALAVFLGALALPFVVPRRSSDLRRLAWLGVGLVVVQALLGATTVWLRLPPPVSIAHLLTASAFLSLVTVIAVRLGDGPRLHADAPSRRLLDAALVALALQLVLGACVRHLHAGYACDADPWGCARALEGSRPALLQLAHRAIGYLVAALVFAAWARGGAIRSHASVPLVLVLVQVSLGLATVALALPITLVTLHLIGAELLLVALVALRTRLAPLADAGLVAGADLPTRGLENLAARDA